ncbi:hypothetical protein JCM1841_004326 [Sporobolomyces salmonicolor]
MPALRSPWSSHSASSSEAGSDSHSHTASSRRSSLNSPSSHAHAHARNISAPMPKKVQFVQVEAHGRPKSQSASLLFGVAPTGAPPPPTSTPSSSPRPSLEHSGGRHCLQPRQPPGLRVVVTEPTEASALPALAEQRNDGLPNPSMRYSTYTMGCIDQLVHQEDGALLLWMKKLSGTPANSSRESFDSLSSLPDIDDPAALTPPLSPSTSATSSPASFHLLATPPSPEGARRRLRSASTPAPTTSSSPFSQSRLFHPSRWRNRKSASDSFSSIPEDGELNLVASSPAEDSSQRAVVGLGLSLSASHLVDPLHPSSTAPAPAMPHHVHFLEPRPSLSSLSSSSSLSEWEHVSTSTPSSRQGRYAPPRAPHGSLRKVVAPHPWVEARKSYRGLRDPPALPEAEDAASLGWRTPRGSDASSTGSVPTRKRWTREPSASEAQRQGTGKGKGKGKERERERAPSQQSLDQEPGLAV